MQQRDIVALATLVIQTPTASIPSDHLNVIVYWGLLVMVTVPVLILTNVMTSMTFVISMQVVQILLVHSPVHVMTDSMAMVSNARMSTSAMTEATNALIMQTVATLMAVIFANVGLATRVMTVENAMILTNAQKKKEISPLANS